MFERKKQKLDAKVRYQHKSFSNQVKAASQYRRSAQPVSDSRFWQLARELGLDSPKRLVIVFAVIAFASAVVFAPSPLFIKHIAVDGASEDVNRAVAESVEAYFSSSSSLFPKRNSLFLNTQRLVEIIKQKNDLVLSVDQVRKTYSGKLDLQITQKFEAFTLVTNRGAFVAYNDGVIKERLVDGQPIKGLGVDLPTDTYLETQANYFDASFAKALADVRKFFPAEFGIKLDSAQVSVPMPLVLGEADTPGPAVVVESEEVPSEEPGPETIPKETQPVVLPPPTIELSTDRPYKPEDFRIIAKIGDDGPKFSIIVETIADMQEVLDRFNNLLKQLSAEQRARLVYVDLRYEQRGYVCLAGTRCAQDFLRPVTPPPEQNSDQPTEENTPE